MALQEAQGLLDKFKAAYNKNDVKTATDLLGQLKLKLIELPSLPPVSQPSPTAQQELLLARDAFEHGALLAIRARDEAAAERAFAQLKVFYADTRLQLPASAQEAPLLGLNLLRLLVANRIAEFHTELEVLPLEAQSAPYVAHAVQLEQWLMEGAYKQVLAASRAPPSDAHAALMSQLEATVRDEVASCAERAYTRLRLADAAKLMMLEGEQAAAAFAAKHGWQVEGGYIVFQGAGSKAAGAAGAALPPMTLITNTLVYAKELERIV